MPAEMIVTTTNTLNIPFVKMTLESQEAVLLRIDPARWDGEGQPPLTAREWNRQMRRVKREKQQRMKEIASLRKQCLCKNCRKHHQGKFPAYYVARHISYECWLEQQEVDPEMAEVLAPLRMTREKVGAAFVGALKKLPME